MNEVTKEWVDKAESDFSAADLTLHGGEAPIVDAVCFHSQQCAEKYVKAFLQENRIRFERRHELDPLLDLCVLVDAQFEVLRETLKGLERYAVMIRYPGWIVPVEMAEQAFESAGRVRDFVQKKLALK